MRKAVPAVLMIVALGGAQAELQPSVPPSQAKAPSGDGDLVTEVVTDIRVSRKFCNVRIAKKLELRAIGAGIAFNEPCVATLGEIDEAIYAATSPQGGRVGLYGRRHFKRLRGRRPYILVGRVSDCATLWAAFPDVGGYCHSKLEGPILILSEVKPVRGR